MTERIFRAGYVEMFNEVHPAAEGWLVYQESRTTAHYLAWLPEFVKERHPEWAVKMQYMTIAAESKESAEKIKNQEKVDLEFLDWVGAIELKIDGKELHFRRYTDALYCGLFVSNEHFSLVAIKDVALLEKLYAELKQYSAERLKCGTNIITIRGTHFPKPHATWDDLILPGNMAEELRTNLDAFFSAKERYKELGLTYKRGYIFAGPPGTGKTLTAKIIASRKDLTFVILQHSEMQERGNAIEEAFELAKKHAPSVLLLEDLDRLAQMGPAVTQILNCLDDFEVNEGVLVITTVNDIARMDSALVHRPSRFDRIWEFPLPGQPQRLAMLKKLAGRHFTEAAMEKAAAETDGFSMAYVQEVFSNALLIAVSKNEEVGDAHLDASLAVLKKQFKSTDAKDGLKARPAPREHMGFNQ